MRTSFCLGGRDNLGRSGTCSHYLEFCDGLAGVHDISMTVAQYTICVVHIVYGVGVLDRHFDLFLLGPRDFDWWAGDQVPLKKFRLF